MMRLAPIVSVLLCIPATVSGYGKVVVDESTGLSIDVEAAMEGVEGDEADFTRRGAFQAFCGECGPDSPEDCRVWDNVRVDWFSEFADEFWNDNFSSNDICREARTKADDYLDYIVREGCGISGVDCDRDTDSLGSISGTKSCRFRQCRINIPLIFTTIRIGCRAECDVSCRYDFECST